MNDFSKHTIEVKGEREFLFSNNSSFLKMYFIVRHGRVVILGDCGDWIFARHHPFQLLLGATDKDFFWSKRSNRDEVYSEEKTRKFVEEIIRDGVDLDENGEEYEFGSIELMNKKLAQLKELSLDTAESAVPELEGIEGFEDQGALYEYIVYTYPKDFDTTWQGIEAFRKAYWSTIGRLEKQLKDAEEAVIEG